MEDSVLAINTGYWKIRGGSVIERGQGKTHLVNSAWRQSLDDVVRLIGEVRWQLREALALDDDLYLSYQRGQLDELENVLRWDGPLGRQIDELRNLALSAINPCLKDAGLTPLPRVGE